MSTPTEPWDEFPPGGFHSSSPDTQPLTFAQLSAWLRAESAKPPPQPEQGLFLCSPAHAAELRRALQEAWDRYENTQAR